MRRASWQQHGLDVVQHAALSDGHSAKEFVQLLVVAHRQLQVTGDDTGLLVVPSGVSSQLQDLSRQILEHSGQINRSTSTDALGSYLCGKAAAVLTLRDMTSDAQTPKLFGTCQTLVGTCQTCDISMDISCVTLSRCVSHLR